MSIKIGSWNVELRLSDLESNVNRGNPTRILDEIERLDADVLVLPEAFGNEPADEVDERLRAMGYDWRDVEYDDKGRDLLKQWEAGTAPHMRILSRLAIISSEVTRWGDLRNLLMVTVHDPVSGQDLEIIGTHLRHLMETQRLAQVVDAAPFVMRNKTPKVMLGDFNAMHSEDLRAKLLGSGAMRWLARHIPSEYALDDEAAEREDLRSFLMCATDMATGSALTLLESETNLRDLDPRHRATTTPQVRGHESLPNVRLLQIDHMYASPEVEAEKVTISRDGGADHRAISTIICLK